MIVLIWIIEIVIGFFVAIWVAGKIGLAFMNVGEGIIRGVIRLFRALS